MERTTREQFSDMAVVLSIKEPGSEGFISLYKEMLEFIYNLDGLYVILAPDYMEMTRGISIPLALRMQKLPSIYIFTDLELAKNWCDHYKMYYDGDKYPIGYVTKEQGEYTNMFQVAYQLGIYKCNINEGDRLLNFNIADFIRINNLNQSIMVLNIDQIEKLLREQKIPEIRIRYQSIDVLGFDIDDTNDQYIKDTIKKMTPEFSEAIKQFDYSISGELKDDDNSGKKYLSIIANDKDVYMESFTSQNVLKIEKTFFDIVKKYDDKKIFDARYSYLQFGFAGGDNN